MLLRNKDKIEKIYHIHSKSKEFSLKAEEFGLDFKSNLQPYNELKNAYEHLLRAQFVAFGLQAEEHADYYVETNIEKALGHEYRAFFDIADWLSITLRQKISQSLSQFSSDVIHKAIPTYYSQIRPRIEEICIEIASVRGKKDIGNDILVPEVEQYSALVEELLEINMEITRRSDTLIELGREEKNSCQKDKRTQLLLGLFLLLLGAALSNINTVTRKIIPAITSRN